MKRDTNSTLRTDERAVAPVIGFILLFAIGIIAFSSYQAFVVPNQNAEVEFEHLQDVENDLVDVRRGILRAGQSDAREFATVQLGMSYPTRLLALNPPQPTGTLQASEPYDIIIESQDDSDDRADVATRFLTYEPGYNELPSRPVRYENSVLYREAENNVIIEDQELVTDGGTLEITALQNELREQGTGRITVSLFPTRDFTADEIPDGEITVTIPTRLDGDYWDDELEDTDIYVGVDTGAYPDDVNAIEFELDTEETDLDLNTVGIQSEPEDDEKPLKQNVGGGNGGTSGNQLSVTINDAEFSNPDEELTVTFTPDDPNENLDTADITANRNGDEVASKQVDISGQEGTQITKTFSEIGSNEKPDTVTVEVTDTDGNTASNSVET